MGCRRDMGGDSLREEEDDDGDDGDDGKRVSMSRAGYKRGRRKAGGWWKSTEGRAGSAVVYILCQCCVYVWSTKVAVYAVCCNFCIDHHAYRRTEYLTFFFFFFSKLKTMRCAINS